MQILIATNNAGKIREYRSIFAQEWPDVTLYTLRDVGIDHDVAETGTTFEENALLKVQGYRAFTTLPIIADDSGLEVDALPGLLAVYSNRWAGEGTTEAERNTLLLERLQGIPRAERTARFVCITLLAFADGRIYRGEGHVTGYIGDEPRGTGGFGYDPLFTLTDGRTMAELPPAAKYALSHRGRAARAVLEAYRRGQN